MDEAEEGTYVEDPASPGQSLIDLRKVGGFDLDFFFYYPEDVGGNRHEHDVESIETRIGVAQRPGCAECPFVIGLMRVAAKAHGIQWFDNTLDVDATARLPLHVLVEEGKHASCTDRNADGQFTPGYDVTQRVNDAWGVRDTLGTGRFFTGDYKAWMTKVRRDDTRVFPPLPPDSPLRVDWTVDGVYAPGSALYTLRPWPSADKADADLARYITDAGDAEWPKIDALTSRKKFDRWLIDESWAESWALAARGANDDFGFSLSFPLLIFKNVQEPLRDGWLVNRIYFQGRDLEDFGWLINYSPSASRWLDGYFAAGVEWDSVVENGVKIRNSYTVTEIGVKFRFDFKRTRLRFLSLLGTPFWGFRVASDPLPRRAGGPGHTPVDEVRGALGQLRANGRPHVGEVAAATGMSVRTLQRRLAEAGLTYSAIVDEIRSAEARRLLAQPGVLLKQVAADLGFCEPASFTRACRRWTGFSPREYRRQLREASRGGGPLPASRLQI